MTDSISLLTRCFAVSLAGLAILPPVSAEPPLDPQAAMEKKALFAPEEVKAWDVAECEVVTSAAHVKDAAQALHWHVKVDYHAGEKAYPVGWPRTGRTFKAGAEQDWSGWDYLHGWIYAETSRTTLPRKPAGVTVKSAGDAPDYLHQFTDLKKGDWTELLIPISEISSAAAVNRLQFHLSESDYSDGDTLDLYVSDLALLRHSTPTLLTFVPERSAMYADADFLPVMARVTGLKSGETRELTCELRRGAELVTRITRPVTRGEQRLLLDLAGKGLAPGDCDVVATLAGQTKPITAKLRLVESPWK